MAAKKKTTANKLPKSTKTAAAKKTILKKDVLVEIPVVEEIESKTPFWKNKYFLIALIIIAVLVFAAGRFFVVAMVDKNPISRLEYYNALDQRYGKDLREQMIIEKLVVNEAKNRNVTVNQKDIEAEIKKLQEEQGGADKFNQVLQMQGLSMTDVENLVKLQLLKQKMFGQNAKVTDSELNKFIEENKEQLPDPIDGKVKASIKDQLLQQKVTEDFNKWLQTALQSSRVQRL